jgi:hypothetical protein
MKQEDNQAPQPTLEFSFSWSLQSVVVFTLISKHGAMSDTLFFGGGLKLQFFATMILNVAKKILKINT